MGLDMSLEKKTYVKNWDHHTPEQRHTVTVTGPCAASIKSERISYITEEVIVWRKANAVHQWFVTNVQKGVDNCGTYYVSTKKLKELAEICEQIIAATVLVSGKIKNGYTYANGKESPVMENGKYMDYEGAKLASELLPTTSGFFFGSTDYDEFYFDDIKGTAEKLRALLKEDGEGSYYYSSSW